MTRATAILKGNFSHIPQQRREEVARRRKQRKREWMAKVYMLGKQGKEPRDLQDDFEGEASMIDLDVHDDEELLKWSEALDFDSYLDTWTMTATSNSTEAYIPQNYAALMEEESVLVMADSATLFAQKRMPSEPFKGGTGVTTLNFRASDLRT